MVLMRAVAADALSPAHTVQTSGVGRAPLLYLHLSQGWPGRHMEQGGQSQVGEQNVPQLLGQGHAAQQQ